MSNGHLWEPGYTLTQINEAQDRYGFQFPPDLIELFLERRPVSGYKWHTEDPDLRAKIEWPLESLAFDVEQGFWLPDWGERPVTSDGRQQVLRAALAKAPRLIPLIGHRFLPETPNVSGNPVLSVRGFDTIYYGANLCDFFKNHFEKSGRFEVGPVRHIMFWSDLIENWDVAYGYYESAQSDH